MPVTYRKWFLNRLLREFKEKNEALNSQEKSDVNHDNISALKKYEDMLSNKS